MYLLFLLVVSLFLPVFSWPCFFVQLHFDLQPKFTLSFLASSIHCLAAEILQDGGIVLGFPCYFRQGFHRVGSALEAELKFWQVTDHCTSFQVLSVRFEVGGYLGTAPPGVI